MSFLWVWIGLGVAGVPGEILATAAPPGIEALWTEEARLDGTAGAASELACRTLAEDIPLCFRVEQDGRRRWVTKADLLVWGVSIQELERLAGSALSASPLKAMSVEGTAWRWWTVQAKSGREGTVLLHPEWLEVVGPEAVLAIPGRDTLFAWNIGNEELDKIMVVGIRKAMEQSEVPVTGKILGFREGAWFVRGELKSSNP